jgi:arsenate reductase-like glutaredoxin family protein
VPDDAVPASRKLGRAEAQQLADAADTLVVSKGKKVTQFSVGKNTTADAVDAMLGPTGNLRAPTLRSGKTLIVGFSEDEYRKVLAG